VRALIWMVAFITVQLVAVWPGVTDPSDLQLTPLVAKVITAPYAVSGSDQRIHLVYEVKVANITDGPIRLQRITVRDGQNGTTLTTLDAQAINERFSLGGRRGSESTELGPFQSGVLFVHVPLAHKTSSPSVLNHLVEASVGQPSVELSIPMAETPVITAEVPVLGPLFRGGGYVAADGCCDSIRHVRALLALNGRFHLSQRFAVDWERIDNEGTVFRGEAKDVHSYHIYGAPILAVADGIVVASRNDLVDQLPGNLPNGLPLDEADGNFAILNIGGAAYALYAHMEPGSVRIRAGDRVRRGDHIGNVGNTGNTQAPHLHFQMMDGPSGFASNGIPYVFDTFAVTAVDEAGTADFDRAEATGSRMTLAPRIPATSVRKALPLDLSVVDWRN
jgi:murein DD-endopeptidase MepM/ murein hydrolase activator NlpD